MEFKGYTYGYLAKKGELVSEEAKFSLDRLLDTGTDYVCLTVALTQDTFASTTIKYDFKRTPSDSEIIATVKRIHEAGARVCLKPMVNCDDGMWRAYINFPDETMFGDDPYWSKWFDSYNSFMLHYAEIAEETGCELLCIGCELCGTERKEVYWRKLIELVRGAYHGKLTYNTNHGKEENVGWFDALDYLGTSAYFPVAKEANATVEEMTESWERISDYFDRLHKKFGKPILFMEIGCRSAAGCAAMPWDFSHRDYPMSEDEQANFYDSCLKVFSGKEWFAGMFWWDWSTRVYHEREKAENDRGFNIYLKKAEQILRKWYK